MALFTLLTALGAAGYGLATAFRPKTPLFYQIVVYGFCCYLLSVVYDLLFTRLYAGEAPFHAGYLGYAGAFFFLFSSYFGALDRLADGGEAVYRPYRLAALLPAGAVAVLGALVTQRLALTLVLLPVAAAAYYACKHLILPDVEMGIIRVMRPYNAILLALCLLQPFAVEALLTASGRPWAVLLHGLLVLAAVPVARKEVGKWFM